MGYRYRNDKITLHPFVKQSDYETGMETMTPAQWMRMLKSKRHFDNRAEAMQRRLETRAQELMDAQNYMVRMDLTGKPEYEWQNIEEERQECERIIKQAVILERHLHNLQPIIEKRRACSQRINQLWREMYAHYEALHTPAKKLSKDAASIVLKKIAAYKRLCGKKLPLTEQTLHNYLILSHSKGSAKFKVL